MSTRYMSRDELFVWRDEMNDAAERRADKRERFAEPTEADIQLALSQNKCVVEVKTKNEGERNENPHRAPASS